MMLYEQSAEVYDAIYTQVKDYGHEAEKVTELLQRYATRSVKSLLDIACGTGLHLEHLRQLYQVEGLDLSEAQLGIARKRLPNLPLHLADMRTFQLERSFDAVTCLFSAIGHLSDNPALHQAVKRMAAHLNPGGVLIIEPWIYPSEFREGSVHLDTVDEPGLKVARVSISYRDGNRTILEMHHVVATPGNIRSYMEKHSLTMFTHEEYLEAFEAAGLTVHHEAWGFTYHNGKSRGLYLGVK